MSSFEGVHRTSSPKTSTHRGQKPYSRKGTDRAKLRRGQSGFLDGLRNIVSGPLSWLAAIGKDQADSDEENIPGDDAMTGSKRRSTVQKVDGSTPARKRARREASPVTGSQGGPGGYLDPPYVLKDFSSLPNVPSSRQANRGSSVGRGDVLVRNAIEPEPSPLLGLGTEERRPHRQIASNGHTSAFDVGSTDYANSSDGRLRQSSSFLNGSPNSSTLPRHKTPTGGLQDSPRKQSNVIRFDYSPKAVGSSPTTATPRSALGSRPLGDGVIRSQSRTPSLHDLTTDRPRVSSPERDRTQGPLRMGSALRQSHTPMDLQNRLSPTKLSRSSGGAGGSLFGPPVTNPLVRRSSSIMALDSSGLSPLGRRQSSQMIFEPSLGITTAEEAAAAAAASATSSPAKPRPPRNNAERILLALEQSTPLTDARKLRLKQKEAIRPPKPLRSLDSRTNRMLNPYGRPTLGKANSKQQNEDPSLPSERTPGALRRYLDAGRKAKGVQKFNDAKSTMDVVVEEVDDDKQMDTTDEQTTGREGAASSKQDKSVEAMPEESAEKVRSTSMPGRPTSSLRSGRAPAYRTHVPSSRPTNRFSAKFLDDDDGDAMDNDTASLSPAELSKWAEKGTGALEVPAGFSFDFGAKAAESKALADLKEKEKRDALLARLRGDVPAAVSFATPDGKAALPAVPSLPFKFGGVTLAAPKKETPKAEAPAPPVTKAVEPQVPPKTSEPKYPAELSVRPPVAPAATSLPFSFATTDTTRSLFAPSAPAVAAQPSVDTTPKATNAPVPALPFSFGSSSTPAAKPTSSFSFSFGGGGSFTPSPFAVSSLAPAAKATDTIPEAKDATPSSTSTKSPFSFGSTAPSQSIFGAPSTAPTTSSGSQSLTPAAEPIRSTAPSPSPFATLGKEKLLTPNPISTTSTASAEQVASPSPTPVPSAAINAASTETVPGNVQPPTAPPATGTPFTFGSTPKTDSVPTATPSPAPLFSFNTLANSNTPKAPETTDAKPNPFASPANAAGSTPLFTFGGTGAKPSTPAQLPFSFGSTPTTKPAAPTAPTSSPFSFASTTATGLANATTFSFGQAPANKNAFGSSPTKPQTPPPQEPQDNNMMDEGSPTREVQPTATTTTAPTNPFSFSNTQTTTSVPPTTPAAPSFGFSFSTPGGSNPFAKLPVPAPAATNGTSAFGNNNLSAPSPAAPFGQPTPASPFPSQPNSPFHSPLQQPAAVSSPAQPALTFGAPQQPAPGFGAAPAPTFTFTASSPAASTVTSPTQASMSTPTFVFGAKPAGTVTSPVGDRPIKPPPRRTGSTAARRGTSSGTRR